MSINKILEEDESIKPRHSRGEKVAGFYPIGEMGMSTYFFSTFKILGIKQIINKNIIYSLKPLLIKRYHDVFPCYGGKVASWSNSKWIFFDKKEERFLRGIEPIKEGIEKEFIELSESELRPCRASA